MNKVIAQLGGNNPHKHFPDAAFALKEMDMRLELESFYPDTPLGMKVYEIVKEKHFWYAVAIVYDSYHQNKKEAINAFGQKIIEKAIAIVEYTKKEI